MTDSASPDYSVLDNAGAADLAFYPRRDHTPPRAGDEDLAFEVEPGVSLAARFYSRNRALPTILYFHGNGEVASDHDDVAQLYANAGANLFVVEFRGYGRSTGLPTFATLVSDAAIAVREFHALLDERGFNPCRVVMGRSLGAHSALEVAARHGERFRGLIIESGAGDVRRFLSRLGSDVEAPGPATALADAHDAKVRSIQLPTLIIHGEQDELVPVERAFELRTALEHVHPALEIIPRAGHNDLLWLGREQYFEAIAEFLATVCVG